MGGGGGSADFIFMGGRIFLRFGAFQISVSESDCLDEIVSLHKHVHIHGVRFTNHIVTT